MNLKIREHLNKYNHEYDYISYHCIIEKNDLKSHQYNIKNAVCKNI